MPDLVPVDYDPFSAEQMGTQSLAGMVGKVVGGLGQQVLNLPKQALQSSEQLRTTGDYDPAPVVNAATLAMTGGLGGVPMEAGEAALGAGPIRAYHGSPYDFDQFDISKVGTGEGAQTYGHGLYFAENPETAASYREKLRTQDIYNTAFQEVPYSAFRAAGIEKPITHADTVAGFLKGNPFGKWSDFINYYKFYNGQQPSDLAQPLFDKMQGAINPGHIYEININADPEHFLDWDKPLSEQTPEIQAALHPFGFNTQYHASIEPPPSIEDTFRQLHGSEALQRLVDKFGPEGAAAKMKELGIPGIKYLDQGSRGSGAGTHNYVVFDPSIIDIIKKYGIAGLIGGGAAHFSTTPVDNDPFAGGPNG